MAIEVETKDCTALSDAELGEMADICTGGPARFRDRPALEAARKSGCSSPSPATSGKLHGFSFSTLERIGGTPCVLIGLASVKRTSKRDAVLKAIMHDQFRRAVLAFPDEDVLVGTRFAHPSGFEAFKALERRSIPRPGHKAIGEERAWGRRLAKRFGVEGTYDEHGFSVKGNGAVARGARPRVAEARGDPADVAAFFKGFDANRGDCLVAFGWAMAEDLAKLA